MPRIRVIWEENGIEHAEIVNGHFKLSEAAWQVALDYVEDPANAKLINVRMLDEQKGE